MRLLTLLLATCALSTPALACVQPLARTVIAGQAPADGATDVPVDACVVFDVRFTRGQLSSPDHPTGYVDDVTVRLGEMIVPGTLSLAHAVGVIEQAHYEKTQALQVIWTPDAPLASATEYTVEYTLLAPECGVQCEPETTTATFTTGDAEVAPLIVEAAPSLTPAHRRICVRETQEEECERLRCQEYATDPDADTLHVDVGFANLPVGAVTRIAVGPELGRMTVESITLRSPDRRLIIGRDQLGGDAVCVEATVIDAVGREVTEAYPCFDAAGVERLPAPVDGETAASSNGCSASGGGSDTPLIAGLLALLVGLRVRRRSGVSRP